MHELPHKVLESLYWTLFSCCLSWAKFITWYDLSTLQSFCYTKQVEIELWIVKNNHFSNFHSFLTHVTAKICVMPHKHLFFAALPKITIVPEGDHFSQIHYALLVCCTFVRCTAIHDRNVHNIQNTKDRQFHFVFPILFSWGLFTLSQSDCFFCLLNSFYKHNLGIHMLL